MDYTESMDMTNKRHSNRRTVFYYLEVTDQEHDEPLGRLGDISAEGLMLLAPQDLAIEKQYDIVVHLPDTPAFEGRKLALKVETRWSRPDHNPAIHRIGCSLVAAPPDKETILKQLIDYYGFSDGYKSFRQPAAT